MSPILGIYASSNYQRVTDTGDMFPIGVVTVGSGGASSITFSSIPATYTHLQIRGIARSTQAASGNSVIMYINNVTTASGNYSVHVLTGTGSAAQAYGASNDVIQNSISAGNETAGVFGAFCFDILDYTNTNKTKTVRSLGGYDNNGSGLIRFASGMLHSSTAAITTIRLDP